MNDNNCKDESEDGLLTDFFKEVLFLNMFIVHDEYGKVLQKPEEKYEYDVNYLQKAEHYNECSKTILFPDFYIDTEVKDMVLLKNDLLAIIIVLVYKEDSSSELEFVGVKTIGDLVSKYPKLWNSKAD